MPKGKATKKKTKTKTKAKAKSLHINSMSSIKGLMPMLKNGCVTIVVILADWCGACQRVKPMWLQTLTKQNKNNVALIRDDMLPNTMLNDKLKITHFPSVFQIPPGGEPTLLENVSDVKSIDSVVNNAPNTPKANANTPNANANESNANEPNESNADANESNWNTYESNADADADADADTNAVINNMSRNNISKNNMSRNNMSINNMIRNSMRRNTMSRNNMGRNTMSRNTMRRNNMGRNNMSRNTMSRNNMGRNMNVKKGFTPTLEKLKGGKRRRTRRNTRR